MNDSSWLLADIQRATHERPLYPKAEIGEATRRIASLLAHRPFQRRIGQQTGRVAMRSATRSLDRLRYLNVLPFSANWRC